MVNELILPKLSVDQALIKASTYLKRNELAEAQKIYDAILRSFPKNIRAQQGLAYLNKSKQTYNNQSPPQETIDQLIRLYNQGNLLAVVEQAKTLTKQYPEVFLIWNILGVASIGLGKLEHALEAFKKVTRLNPNYPDGHNNLGTILRNLGNLDEALASFNKALSLKPNYFEAYYNVAHTLKDQGKLQEAIDNFKKTILLKPDYVDAYISIGVALKDQGKMDEAITAYNKAISLKPNYAEAYCNMGVALRDQGKLDEAITAYNKAISLKSDYAEAYNNMGFALKDQGKMDEAITAYNMALSIKPDYAEAHLNLSFILLYNSRLKEGLDKYEWRWKTKKSLSQKRHFLQPLWDGKISLRGKRILFWSEQGIGDTINWSSFIPIISSQAEFCILECQKKLVPLLKRTFPHIDVKTENRSLDSQRNDFDFHLPLGSLYKHLIKDISKITKPKAFLVPDPVRVKFWKERLKSLGNGPFIGISWKSSDMSPHRLQHFPPISDWCSVLKIPNVIFINMQYCNFKNDLEKIHKDFGVTVHNFNDLNHYDDIDEVAALSAALDIVVCTKTTVRTISAGVGTTTKIANWRQSSFNTILNTPVTSSFDVFDRDSSEPWNNVFSLIAEDITKSHNNYSS